MSEILNKQICLVLNKNWLGYDYRTIRRAIEDITSVNPQTGKPPFMFLDLIYAQNEDGSYNTEELISANPVSVEQWMDLPVRSCDIAINCGRRQLRAPTVIVATNYADIPVKKMKFTPENLKKLYNYTCPVSKEKLAPEELDVAHDVARYHGGARNWENTAPLKKSLNRQQGTRTFAEMGWEFERKKPKEMRIFMTLADMKHESQRPFLN